MVDALPPLPAIARLSPRVVRILGDNPGKFTLQGSNTYLIGQGRRRILLDTGEGRAGYGEALRRVLRDEGARVGVVLLTHWHHDHVGGVPQVLQIAREEKERRRAQGKSSGGEGEEEEEEEPKVYKHQPDARAGQADIADGDVFRVEGATLRAVFSPGHTADHMAFVLEEEGGAMFTGDNVLGHGTAVFEDLAAYLASLQRMLAHYPRGGGAAAARAYPGHGAVLEDGAAKIREYIAHRRQREQEVLAVLRDRKPAAAATTDVTGRERGAAAGGEGWRSMEIVKVIYRDYPENLHAPAEGGVRLVLQKLRGEGRVRECADGSWVVEEGKAAL